MFDKITFSYYEFPKNDIDIKLFFIWTFKLLSIDFCRSSRFRYGWIRPLLRIINDNITLNELLFQYVLMIRKIMVFVTQRCKKSWYDWCDRSTFWHIIKVHWVYLRCTQKSIIEGTGDGLHRTDLRSRYVGFASSLLNTLTECGTQRSVLLFKDNVYKKRTWMTIK